jgi:hypothetical protein
MKRIALLLLALPALALAQDAAPPPPDEAPLDELAPPPPPPVSRRVLVPEGGEQRPPRREAPPREGPRRDGWYVGFGVGSGGGWVTDAGTRTSFKDFNYQRDRGTFAFNFNAGATLSPTLLLGGEVGALGTSGREGGHDSSIVTAYLDGVVTYFPTGRGLFVRGGAGASSLQLRQELPGETLKDDWDGGNVLAGLGYAWWLGRSFNLVAQLDGMKTWYRSNGPDSSETVALTLGFEWY